MGGDSRIDTELAGYRIERLIGRGGMSVVYLAEHLRLRRKVALKILASELAENASFRDRFIRESQLAAGLDHPNVIPVYDAGETDGVLYIAMRFVSGTDLAHVLRDGPLELSDTVRVVDAVANALDAAHAQGLVHRDVKPGNVLIASSPTHDRMGHLYLADFGLTKRALSVSGITHTGQFVGTIDYVAPEQIKGEQVDGRTDVYSLGCLLFECLTGQAPFERDNEVASIYAHLNDPPPSANALRPELPRGVDGVISKAMAKSPDDRHANAGALTADLRSATGVAAGRTAESVLPPTVPLRRRRTFMIAGAVAAAVVAAVIAAVIAFSGGGSNKNSLAGNGSRPGTGLVPNVQGIAELDPQTGKVVAHTHIDLGTGGTFHSGGRLVAGEGAVWVVGGSGGGFQIQKVDPRTASVTQTLHPTAIGSGILIPIAIGDGRIWLVGPGSSAGAANLFRLDPATNRVTRTIAVSPTANGIGIGKGTVWISTQDGRLLRVGFGSSQVDATYDVGSAASGVAVTTRAVWISNAIEGVVYRFDPVKKKVVQTVTLPGGADAITAGEGAVWVMDRTAGSVIRIDPSTGSTASPIRVGALPSGIVTGAGSVWVADGGDGTVSRIDPVTYHVSTYRLTTAPSPFDIAVGEDGVWTTLIGPAPNAHG